MLERIGPAGGPDQRVVDPEDDGRARGGEAVPTAARGCVLAAPGRPSPGAERSSVAAAPRAGRPGAVAASRAAPPAGAGAPAAAAAQQLLTIGPASLHRAPSRSHRARVRSTARGRAHATRRGAAGRSWRPAGGRAPSLLRTSSGCDAGPRQSAGQRRAEKAGARPCVLVGQQLDQRRGSPPGGPAGSDGRVSSAGPPCRVPAATARPETSSTHGSPAPHREPPDRAGIRNQRVGAGVDPEARDRRRPGRASSRIASAIGHLAPSARRAGGAGGAPGAPPGGLSAATPPSAYMVAKLSSLK